jgi:hypothetical protein
MTLRIKIANNNNGPCTLDIGAGPSPFVNPDGTDLGSGALIAGGWAEFVDNVTNYQLISSSQQAQSSAGAATTGDMKFRPTSEPITGWVVANTTTIGNATSNATQRANADTSNLFTWHWNNFSNAQCPVFTSAGAPTTRGANAAADFAANKAIATYDMRGRGAIGIDTMGGPASTFLNNVPVVFGSRTVAGSVLGENLHTLLLSEMASHQHAVFLRDLGHLHGGVPLPGGSAAPQPGNNTVSGTQNTATAFTGITIGSVNGVANDNQTAASGGGGAHNTVQLSTAGTWYIKL